MYQNNCNEQKCSEVYQKINDKAIQFSLESITELHEACCACQKKHSSNFSLMVSNEIENLYAAIFIDNAIKEINIQMFQTK